MSAIDQLHGMNESVLSPTETVARSRTTTASPSPSTVSDLSAARAATSAASSSYGTGISTREPLPFSFAYLTSQSTASELVDYIDLVIQDERRVKRLKLNTPSGTHNAGLSHASGYQDAQRDYRLAFLQRPDFHYGANNLEDGSMH